MFKAAPAVTSERTESLNANHQMQMEKKMERISEKAQEILEFWFGDGAAYRPEWFEKDPEFDERIRQRFGEDLERAIRGEYDAWAAVARGRLALVILLDQFSRNLFRGSPKSWAQDPKALDLVLEGIKLGHDTALSFTERMFFYLPLEHSEELAMQELSVLTYRALVDSRPADDGAAKTVMDYAERHHEIIERFGRFPHRNEVLGRESTPEELEFLTQPNSSF
jgi:uncharacterized protein (DUF924 family)